MKMYETVIQIILEFGKTVLYSVSSYTAQLAALLAKAQTKMDVIDKKLKNLDKEEQLEVKKKWAEEKIKEKGRKPWRKSLPMAGTGGSTASSSVASAPTMAITPAGSTTSAIFTDVSSADGISLDATT